MSHEDWLKMWIEDGSPDNFPMWVVKKLAQMMKDKKP